MDIGIVAKHAGLPASTLRFYEEKGLIESVGRKGLRRLFDEDVLDRLALIALGQHAGFTLDEIAAMFTSKGPKIDREQLLEKADQLDRTIKKLEAMSKGLRHAAKCSAPNHFECSKFQRLLNVATKSQQKRKAGKSVK
ncbi:MerR family transcriptional regulator [Hahella sp. CCB-MM4]|nr:helix-turn-helix domain-containing protein [Hahella sp. CCB-MM4]OZG72222.1 MerR family transcriptional regulator [Hahella sp. CCB-MM4]